MPRLLVLLVPVETPVSATAIQNVIAAIPAPVFEQFETETLVIQDGDPANSPSATAAGSGSRPVTFLWNPAREGYGGGQKIGFHYAIERGFDFVVLVHAGGKYAAESLPALLEPVVSNAAEAVYGSRMLPPGGARRAMPFYKYLGNRWLSAIQTKLLRTRLSEFHSGYRVYAVAALKRIPFQFNSNALHFDTEITIQLLRSGARIAEVAVPAYVSSDITMSNGFSYSWNVLATCLRARAQELSLFFDRKFDCAPSTVTNIHYTPRLGFPSTHTMALEAIPAGARVLDIGCAGGYLGHILRERGCHTTGVDKFPLAPGNELDAFHLLDLNTLDRTPLPVDMDGFDNAVMLDVIEHLQSPETFVDEFRRAAARNPKLTLFISTPNIGFFVVRLMLLAGKFNYGKRGILDLTHTRLFTFGTFRRLFEQSGYDVLEMRGVPAPFPLALGDGWISRALLAVNSALIRISRRLFAFQIFAVVRPRPGLPYLLDHAVIERSGAGRGFSPGA